VVGLWREKLVAAQLFKMRALLGLMDAAVRSSAKQVAPNLKRVWCIRSMPAAQCKLLRADFSLCALL